MAQEIQPLGTKVLLVMDKKEEKHGCLFIPETVGRNSDSIRCTVIAVGSGCSSLERGQVVLIDASTVYDSVTSVGKHLDEDHIIVEESYVLAVEEDS